uniref:J domain-containing protein n=1 Tax=Macrostomum lignano TaxID=282301 RepID=A0A1I8HEH7_9PLAT
MPPRPVPRLAPGPGFVRGVSLNPGLALCTQPPAQSLSNLGAPPLPRCPPHPGAARIGWLADKPAGPQAGCAPRLLSIGVRFVLTVFAFIGVPLPSRANNCFGPINASLVTRYIKRRRTMSSPTTPTDLYGVLGVGRTANSAEIEAACSRLYSKRPRVCPAEVESPESQRDVMA